MAFDQAEDLRRRLEATQTGQPYVSPPPLTAFHWRESHEHRD